VSRTKQLAIRFAVPVGIGGLAGVAVIALMAVPGFWPSQTGAPDAAIASTAATPDAAPAFEASLQAARDGLTYLRQAAKTGEPSALQEAERDILLPLLDALAATKVDGRVDPARYQRVYQTVIEVQGLFREIPYFLEVQPGGDMPSFRLLLRRSPVPAIQSRSRPLGWRVETLGDGVILRP
jgi:hypothetical protein